MASIDKHGKGYRVRVYYKDEEGKRKAITETGIKTMAEAKKTAARIEADLDKNIIMQSVPTLYDYIDQYIETYRVGKVSVASTDIDRWSKKRLFKIVKYDKTTKERSEIQLYDENIKLDKVTGTMHQGIINQLFEHEFSLSTIKKTNSLMYRVMERARYDGYITFNPAEMIEYKIIDEKKNAEYIPHDKIEPFLADVKRRNVYHYFLFRLIIETGLRVGEACALTFQDIDRANNTIHVTKSYDQKRDMLGPTKTKHHRNVYITQSLSNELFKMLQLHNANKIINQSLYSNKYNFIFVDDYGQPISRSSIHNSMIYCSNKILGSQLSVHKLRHTHATLLLEAGVPMKVIQDRLGHQSMEMTERVYSHVTPAMKEEGMDAFNQYIKNVF
ncbi:site-specific integrase [Macrococcus equipercicus]|uniref:Site-specific integrase n=1 Tax=Macrococcus equipercicus TaxID=69967 RepID=A0A9Q9BP83_9STAP|nr:site-specific integrase [Macrococcus equipercicus]UTH14735.1 site-specific integrase [Macrococcus equipercicus]